MTSNLEEVFTKHGAPKEVLAFLGALDPPIDTPAGFANVVLTLEDLQTTILTPVVGTWDSQKKLPAQASTRAAWRECAAKFEAEVAPDSKKETPQEEDAPVPSADKAMALEAWKKRFGRNLPLDETPSDRLLGAVTTSIKKNTHKLFSLKEVKSALESAQRPTSSQQLGSVKFTFQNEEDSKSWSRSPLHLIRSVRVLMNAYVLGSIIAEASGRAEFCSFEAAYVHVDELEFRLRNDGWANPNFSKILDVEFSLRTNWAKALAAAPESSMNQIIPTVNHSFRSAWPPVPAEGKPKRSWDQSNETPCRNYASGHCGKGDRCRFKHDKSAVGDNPKKGKHQKRWTPKEDWSKSKST